MSRGPELTVDLVDAAVSDYMRAMSLGGHRGSVRSGVLMVTVEVARPKTHFHMVTVAVTAPLDGRHGFPGQRAATGETRRVRRLKPGKPHAAMSPAQIQFAGDVVARAYAFATATGHVSVSGIKHAVRWSPGESSGVDIAFADPREIGPTA